MRTPLGKVISSECCVTHAFTEVRNMDVNTVRNGCWIVLLHYRNIR